MESENIEKMDRNQLEKMFPVLVTCREDLVDFCNLWEDYKCICYNGKPLYIVSDVAAIYVSNNSLIGGSTPSEYISSFIRLRIDWSIAKEDWKWKICEKKTKAGKKIIKEMIDNLVENFNSSQVEK